MTDDQYDARCSCGEFIVGTLTSDPSVPWYRCGRVGRGPCPVGRLPMWRANLEPITAADLAALADLTIDSVRAVLGASEGPPETESELRAAWGDR